MLKWYSTIYLAVDWYVKVYGYYIRHVLDVVT